jgi:hypothetical protein
VLAVLGTARTHQHNFPLFLTVVVGLAAVITVVFVATASSHGD